MLSDSQIEALFKFCKKKFVYYYDVQVELVDHLANAIEYEMEKDENLSFENALQKVYSGFGIMGFSTLVAEKVRQSEKYNRRLFWRLYKSQFGWPQIIGFITLNLFLITILISFPQALIWILLAAFFLTIPFYIFKYHRFNKLIRKTKKKFVIFNLSGLTGFFTLPWYFFQMSFVFDKDYSINYQTDFYLVLFYSVAVSLYIIGSLTISKTIDSAKKSLTESFPEVFKLA